MEHSELAKIFKALSNEQRLGIFKMIYGCSCGSDGGKNCCGRGVKNSFTKACDCFSLSRSTVSHHITVLQNAGLLTCRREGQSMICFVNEDKVEAIKEFLEMK
jgi:ArsR family transcriptional regulator, arsenate/arsenite/antimonite-responsive transcriptional repressor